MDKKEKLEFANPKVEESIDEKRKSLLLRSTTYLDKNALQYQNGILALLDEDGTIKYLRKENNLLQEDVTAALGVCRSTCSHYERGFSIPSISKSKSS